MWRATPSTPAAIRGIHVQPDAPRGVFSLAVAGQMIAVRNVSPMSTRPCRFCLGLQDDSVFADFDVDETGRAFLRRISFDGYGCCRCEGKARVMNLEDTRILTEAVDRGDLDGETFQNTLLQYFRENADVIWSDALAAHGLLVNQAAQD